MQLDKKLVILAVIVAVFSLVSYAVPEYSVMVIDSSFAIISGIACVLVWRARQRCGLPDECRVWTLLFYTSLLFFLGEFIWGFFEIAMNVALPTPSLADAAWIVGYLLMIVALWKRMRSMFEPMEHSVLAIVIGFTAFIAVLISFLQVWSVEQSFSVFVDFSYPFMDVIILTLLVLITLPLLIIRNKTLLYPWLWLSASYASFILYDLSFAYLRAFGLYETGSFIDPLYMCGYLFWCFAAFAKKQRGALNGNSR